MYKNFFALATILTALVIGMTISNPSLVYWKWYLIGLWMMSQSPLIYTNEGSTAVDEWWNKCRNGNDEFRWYYFRKNLLSQEGKYIFKTLKVIVGLTLCVVYAITLI